MSADDTEILEFKNTSLIFQYRPETFDEVVGQKQPKRWLSEIVRRQEPRHFIISGAYGSGKTSLVKIFAKAMNCKTGLDERPDASPCGNCRACKSENSLQTYDTPKEGGDGGSVGAWLERHKPYDEHVKWVIRFFDECQALKDSGTDLFLHRLEQDFGSKIIYALATTDKSRLKDTLLSRLVQLNVRALKQSDSVQLLKTVCSSAQISYTSDGLNLLAAIVGGHPRALLSRLEDLSHGTVDVESVKREIDEKGADHLVAYVSALASGESKQRRATYHDWDQASADRVAMIIAFLKSVYFQNVCGEDVVVDGLSYSLVDARADVTERFRAKLDVETVSQLKPYFVQMFQFWANRRILRGSDPDLALVMFEHLVDHLQKKPLARLEPVAARPASVMAATPPAPVQGDRYLTGPDIRVIVNRASYFIQRRGEYFNLSLMMTPAERATGEDEAVAMIRAARCQLVDKWTVQASILLLERNDGIVGRLVGFTPAVIALTKSLKRGDFNPALILQDVKKSGEASEAKLRQFHWDSVKALCAGYSGANSVVADDREILEYLRVSKEKRRQVGPLRHELVSFTGDISDETLNEDRKIGLMPIEAQDPAGFRSLTRGWQKEVFDDFSVLRKKHEDELKAIEEIFTGPDQTAKREQLQKRWLDESEARQARCSERWQKDRGNVRR